MGKGREVVIPQLQSLKDYVIDFIGPDRINVRESTVMMFEKYNILTGRLEFRPARCGLNPEAPLPFFKENRLILDPANTGIKYYEYVA